MIKVFVFTILAGLMTDCRVERSKVDDQSFAGAVIPGDCVTLPFKYVIVKNWLKSPNLREIELFFDGKTFSEENLRQVFLKFAKEHPHPQFLNIKVWTDWSQVEQPSDCPPSGIGGLDQRESVDHHRARYFRRGANAYFYYTSQLGTDRMNKVVIAGTSQPRQAWETE